jgi:nucleotide-binding universal stress UspA family protein
MKETGPILVPLDGSETAEGALPFAAALARGLGTALVLVTAWEGTESELGADFPAMALEIEQNARTHFTDYLDRIKARIKDVKVETMIRAGRADEQILAAVTESRARLLVIATHGRSGIGRWMYGSIAGRMLHDSPVPVLAVGPRVLKNTPGNVRISHLMVPLDGSELAEQALPAARSLGSKLGARLSLVRVMRWAAEAYPYALPTAYIPQVDEELEAGAKAYLKRQQEAITDVSADAFVVRGAVADGLIEFAEKQNIDLIVMTTHARGGIMRAALGSIADRMLHAPVPVLMVSPETKE